MDRPHWETDRLVLRLLEPTDYVLWSRTMRRLPPAQTPWEDGPMGLAETREEDLDELIEQRQRAAEADEDYFMSVFTRGNRQLVGEVHLMDVSRRIFQNAYLGYAIYRPYQRNGYAREAAAGAIELAFGPLGLHRVEAGIEPDNAASLAVARSLGMRREGLSARRLFTREAWRDMTLWALTAEEFPACLERGRGSQLGEVLEVERRDAPLDLGAPPAVVGELPDQRAQLAVVDRPADPKQ
jgi:ribosomal-protein-alanine N-acetyltransferase